MHSNQEETGGESDRDERAPSDASRTTAVEAIGALSDTELLAGTRRLMCQSNRVLAALLAHLGEVEARGLHRTRACASLYTYCVYELRMSEDAAFRRVAAARLVKRFPLLFGAVERGELHLTALLLLGPHLTEANVVEVLARAKFRTKKEVVKLVRVLSPLPDIPSRIEPLGLERPRLRPTWGNLVAARLPVRDLPPDQRPSNWLAPSDDPATLPFAAADRASSDEGVGVLGDGTAQWCAPAPAPAWIEQPQGTASPHGVPLSREEPSNDAESDASAPLEPAATTLSGPQRYSVQFTASEEYVALVEEAKSLLAHALPSATLAELHLRAMRALVAELNKRKFAVRARKVTSPAVTEPADATTPVSTDQPNDTSRAPRGAPSSPASDASADSPRQRGRTVPSAVRRSVFERDGHRCAYVDTRGVRCRETQRLELHHHKPFARGGPPTTDNLSLYCSAHNALAAEHDFGRDAVLEKREQRSHFTERTMARTAVPEK